MNLPDYQTLMLPLLKATDDGNPHHVRELIEKLEDAFQLSEEERRELLPSGKQPIFENRVGWANAYLKKAGLLNSEKRGYVQITHKGKKVLRQNPEKIDNTFLKQFRSFQQFVGATPGDKPAEEEMKTEEETNPEEQLETAWKALNETLAADLLQKVKGIIPSKFEQLVIDLLLAMGYGGSRKEAGRLIGRTGDGGIDGIINEDRLGLDKIYLQAKRWENTVPIKEVRDFAGALLAQKAQKGVFITTSGFPNSAHEYVRSIDRNIVLIDGLRLAELMIEFRLGVSTKETYQVKEMDTDYFEG
jgi:restriction system protein